MKTLLLCLAFAASGLAQTSNFPIALDNAATLKVAADNCSSALTAGMLVTDTTAQVANAACMPNDSIITVDAEQMGICLISGNTLTFGTAAACPSLSGRGLGSTTVATHALGALGFLLINAFHHNTLGSAIEAIEAFGSPANVTLTTDAAHPAAAAYFAGPGSIGAAIAAIPVGATATIAVPPGYTDTLGGAGNPAVIVIPSTVAALNLRGGTGNLLTAGAGTETMLKNLAPNVTISGLNIAGAAFTNVIGILNVGGNNFKVTDSTFGGLGTLGTGMQDICIGASCQSGGAAVTGVYLARNRHLFVYQGDIIWNADAVDVDSEYATGLTGDGIYNNTLLNTFAAGAIFRVHNFTFENMGRYCMEWAGNGYQWIDFSHTSCLLNSGGIGGISGGTSSSGGSTDQLIGGVIDSNSVSGNGTAGGGNYGNEIYGHDYKVTNNTVSGSLFIHGFVYGGWGMVFANDHVTGVGQAAAGYGFSPNTTFNTGNYSTHDNTFRDDTCRNVTLGCVHAGYAGDRVDGIHDFRAPGYSSSDASPGIAYASVTLNGQTSPYRKVSLQNSDFNLIAPVNGFSLSSPGSFTWSGVSSLSPNPVQFLNNAVTNQNATQFGTVFSTNSFANLQFTEIGGIYSNVAAIHQSGFGPGSIASYGTNMSLLGAGSGSPVTDFSIISYFPKTTGSGVTPTCQSQSAAGGGVGGATCFVGGNQVQGTVNITTTNVGGAPTAPVTNLLTLTFPLNTFVSNPGCFAAWAGANYVVGYIGGSCSTTAGVTTMTITYFGGSALSVGTMPLSLYSVNYIIN